MTVSNPIVQLVTRSDTVGGVHTHIIDLCQMIVSQGDEVIVLAGPSISGAFFHKLHNLGISYVIVPSLFAPLSPYLLAT